LRQSFDRKLSEKTNPLPHSGFVHQRVQRFLEAAFAASASGNQQLRFDPAVGKRLQCANYLVMTFTLDQISGRQNDPRIRRNVVLIARKNPVLGAKNRAIYAIWDGFYAF